MAKVHSTMKFDKSFPLGSVWRDNWIITKMVQVLQGRTKLTPDEDNLRVIIVKEEEAERTLLLQGDEVELVDDLLVFYLNHSDQDLDVAEALLKKIREAGTAV